MSTLVAVVTVCNVSYATLVAVSSMVIVVLFAMHGCEKVRSLLKKTNMLFIYVQAFISRHVKMIQKKLCYTIRLSVTI